MPLIPPRKVWVSARAAKNRNRNKREIVRAITHPPLKKEMRAVSGSTPGRKRLLAAHAVPQRTGVSNAIFRLGGFAQRWGLRAAPPCAEVNAEADRLPWRRRGISLAMIHSAPEALHFDLNRVKLAIV